MKRKLSIRLLLVTAAVTGLASGCGTGAHQQVIGEKQETRTEQENITEGTSADGAADRHELRVAEQVQAPERYKTEVKDKGLYLTADASVEVPDLDRALIKKSRAVNFTKEEYEKVKEVLSKELELEWGEGKTDRRYLQYEGGVWDYVDVTDADNAEIIKKAEGGSENSAYNEVTNVSGTGADGSSYQLSYRTGTGDITPPTTLIWLSKRIEDGRYIDKTAVIHKSGDEESAARSELAGQLQKKAEALVAEAGFKNYKVYNTRWRESFYRTKEGNLSEFEYWLTFTPSIDGIGCTWTNADLMGNSVLNGPYIDLLLKEDGTLNYMRIIGKEEIEISGADGTFLLPFEAIHQLFEQYCKDFYGNSGEQEGEAVLKDGKTQIGRTEAITRLNVNSVRLEYAFIKRENAAANSEQELIPVWNFYGSISRGPTIGEEDRPQGMVENVILPEGIILSIRADDGRILVE